MTVSATNGDQISDAQLITHLRLARTIAVVGLSPKPSRPSHRVAAYLQKVGYRIIPVRPAVESILGEPCFASLQNIPKDIIIDVVDVFRRAEETPAIANDAAEILTRGKQASRLFWLQSGIVNNAAMRIAQNSGIVAVQDLCLMIEHQRLVEFF